MLSVDDLHHALADLMAYLQGRTILTALNKYVDVLNDIVSSLVPTPACTYEARDVGADASDSALNMSAEDVKAMKIPGLPDHYVTVRPLEIVMLLRNVQPREGLCNGGSPHHTFYNLPLSHPILYLVVMYLIV